MKIASVTPATDWFFCHEHPEDATRFVFHRIAVWALYEDGTVRGLIGGVPVGPQNPHVKEQKLISVPPVNGIFRHLDDMSELERRQARTI